MKICLSRQDTGAYLLSVLGPVVRVSLHVSDGVVSRPERHPKQKGILIQYIFGKMINHDDKNNRKTTYLRTKDFLLIEYYGL